MKRIDEDIANNENEIESLNNNQIDVKKEMFDSLSNWLNEKIKEINSDIKKLEEELVVHKSNYFNKQAEFEKASSLLKNKLIRPNVLYRYYWNHKRKSWNEASKSLYLDFGTCIYEILNNKFLRKINKDEFIKEIMNLI